MSQAAPDLTCPYRGSDPYDTGDSGWFFGRAGHVEQLVARLRDRTMLVVAGPPRCGKSSLVRAGLLPRLSAGALAGSGEWPQSVLTPGGHPLDALWSALGELAGSPLPDIFSLEEAPGAAAARFIDRGVLVVDQLEELFTASSDAAGRGAFVGLLEALHGLDLPDFRLIICVGTDFYGACAGVPWLAGAVGDNSVLVRPMSRDELREAIEGPARKAGLRLEEDLADRIIDDAGDDPLALARTSEVLQATWKLRKARLLTLEGYEQARRPTGGGGEDRLEIPAATKAPAAIPGGPPARHGGPSILVALVLLAVLASAALVILLTQMIH